MLLLPGDRIRHRPRPEAVRGRRARRAQAVPWSSAGRVAIRPLARASELLARRGGLPRARRRQGGTLRKRVVRAQSVQERGGLMRLKDKVAIVTGAGSG